MQINELLPVVVKLVDDSDDESYIECGKELENGNGDICKNLIAAIWEDIEGLQYQNKSLALECLACYGQKYFQNEIDLNVSKALSASDEDLVFCAVASYPDMSKSFRDECENRLHELFNHKSPSIRRAVLAETAWRSTKNQKEKIIDKGDS